MIPLLLTYAQAGEQLAGSSERTVRRMVARGELPIVEIGRRRGIPYAAIADLVARRARTVAQSTSCPTDDPDRPTSLAHERQESVAAHIP